MRRIKTLKGEKMFARTDNSPNILDAFRMCKANVTKRH